MLIAVNFLGCSTHPPGRGGAMDYVHLESKISHDPGGNRLVVSIVSTSADHKIDALVYRGDWQSDVPVTGIFPKAKVEVGASELGVVWTIKSAIFSKSQ